MSVSLRPHSDLGIMFSIKYLIVIVIIIVVIESKQFRPVYTYHRAIDGWLKLHVPGTWHEARQRCLMEGAVLASPANEDMQAALRAEMNQSSLECTGIYTGVHSIFSKGYFYSLEGEPLWKMSVPWLPGEPDNVDNNEDCIAYGNDGVADVKCSELLPFVCYKKSTTDMSIMPCGTIDRDYEFSPETGSCYKLHKLHNTWAGAFKICSAEGGYLAIINSQKEASVLKRINFSHRNLHDSLLTVTYIGIHDWDRNGAWRTVHGKTLEEAGYAVWRTGQPDNASPGEYCGAMFLDATLDDYWCERFAQFMCEKDPNSFQD